MRKYGESISIVAGFMLILILATSTIFLVSYKNEKLIVIGADETVESNKETVIIEEPIIENVYMNVLEFGAKADANYYNELDNTYYKDSAYTIEATDNTKAFETAFNSGYDILIPEGNWYVEDRVIISEGPKIEATNAIIYTRSSVNYKYLFYIKGNGTQIKGMTVKTTLDQIPLILNIEPEAGTGSNVFAFVVEADDVLIDHVITINVCRGVNKGTQVYNKNLTINQCEFYNATMPVFAFYIDGLKIIDSYLEANASGLGPGFHCLYLSAYTKNVEILDCSLVFKSENGGGVIQIYTSQEVNEPIIENITIKNTKIDSKSSHLLVLGNVKGLLLDKITYTKQESYSNGLRNYGKIMYIHDYVYDIIIQNSDLDFFDTASVMNGNMEHYGNIELRNNRIQTNFNEGTNLFTTLFDYKVVNNTITVKERTGGNVFGFSGGGTITYENNILNAETRDLILGSGEGSGTLKLTDNQFICKAKAGGICFYNNSNKQIISAIGNTFIGFDQLVQDNTSNAVIDVNNIYKIN